MSAGLILRRSRWSSTATSSARSARRRARSSRASRDTFGDRLRFVFRHFPLTNGHPNAQHAAEEAEWASALNVFWPMHEALYGAQKNLSDRRMLELAAGLGLPGAELQRAWAAHSFIARVKEDFASGLASGVTGTPSFFINGVRHEAGWDELALSHAIEAALR